MPEDFGKILDLLGGHRLAQDRVVRAAGIDPGGGGGLQVGPRLPEGPGHGQLGQRLRRGHDVDLVDEQAEAVAQVDDRRIDRRRRPAR